MQQSQIKNAIAIPTNNLFNRIPVTAPHRQPINVVRRNPDTKLMPLNIDRRNVYVTSTKEKYDRTSQSPTQTEINDSAGTQTITYVPFKIRSGVETGQSDNKYQVTSITRSNIDGMNLPAYIPEGELNSTVHAAKLLAEAQRRTDSIEGYRKTLHAKRPPGSITSTPFTRS